MTKWAVLAMTGLQRHFLFLHTKLKHGFIYLAAYGESLLQKRVSVFKYMLGFRLSITAEVHIWHTKTGPGFQVLPASLSPNLAYPALYPELSRLGDGLPLPRGFFLYNLDILVSLSSFLFSPSLFMKAFSLLFPLSCVSLPIATSLASLLGTIEPGLEWFSTKPAFICMLIWLELAHFPGGEITYQHGLLTLDPYMCF